MTDKKEKTFQTVIDKKERIDLSEVCGKKPDLKCLFGNGS